MAEHTPGPWTVGNELLREDERPVHGGESGEGIIALVWPWGDDEVGEQDREANARLIAAAPDLLEAAEAVIAEWRRYIEDEIDVADMAQGSLTVLLAAIAKARGEA